MRFVVAFALIGIALLWASWQQAITAHGVGWSLVVLGAYIGICFLTLSVIYGLRAAGTGMERVHRWPGVWRVLRLMLLPYFVLARLILCAWRWFDREGLMNLVAPGLYIARFPILSELGKLREGGVDAIVNLCWEFPRDVAAERITGAEIAYLPILDGTAPTPEQFDEAVCAVAEWHAAGRCVLIHCAQGHGRSATIVAAALVRLNFATDADQALSMIRAARPLAKPSEEQKRALIAYLSSERSAPHGLRGPRGAMGTR